MADVKIPLTYKGHPLRRKDNLIYYGSMADKYIITLFIYVQSTSCEMLGWMNYKLESRLHREISTT